MYAKTALVLVLCATMVAMGAPAPRPGPQKAPQESVVYHISKPIYVRIAAVYTEKLNDKWEITTELLKKYGHTYVGRKMLMAHEWGDPMQAVGTIVSAKVKHDKQYKKDYLEIIARIDDPVAIDRVKKKLFYFVSIGFTFTKAKSSIDGQNWRSGDMWRYVPGRTYTVTKTIAMPFGLTTFIPMRITVKMTAVAIIEDMEGQEISFVNVPASRYARVLEYSKEELSIDK